MLASRQVTSREPALRTPSGADAEAAQWTVPGGRIRVVGDGHDGAYEDRVRRNPIAADAVGVEAASSRRWICWPSVRLAEHGRQRPSEFRPVPHRDVKTTRGVISHGNAPGIHTAEDAYPTPLQCLADKRNGRPVPLRALGRCRERPPAQRAWCGTAPSVFSQLAARLPGVAPAAAVPPGRGFGR